MQSLQSGAAPAATSRAGVGASMVLLVAGFVLISANTRVAFGQIGPLAPVAGFDAATVTLLGLIPPLVMGLFAPLAVVARRRLGEERALFAAGAVLLVGALVRMAGMPGLIAGTVIVSLATAVVNVLVPVFVRKRFAPERTGVMMGVYAMSMGAGSAVIAALMIPVWRASGESWPPAIGLAVIPALLALVGTVPQLRHASRPGTHAGATAHDRPKVLRTWTAWSSTIFFGIQTLLFYATLAWLPSILVAAGLADGSAGNMQALFIVGVAGGGLVAPILAAASVDQRPHILAIVAVCAAGFAGLLIAPDSVPVVWALILGIGLGAGQAVAGVLYARRGRTPDHVAALSTVAQTGGYLIAATGPILASILHDATGSWTAPVTAFLVLLAVNAVASMRAGHDPKPGRQAG
ncbi:MFS transporter [Prescottella equi]|uniref:Transporter, major facilitator family protein n=2 Tax=Rhodococcus hoagii TaxID=43767 RepID=E9SW23_RHOHA|nr:MFS transporter [Prescottella equi]EGD25769.1 transporter, major facilitator family protein [Prescottella equi ATCC 33707]MBP0076416.1 MFS transporter [Prescottella equi]MBP0081897.1 MFS transporter [Prescottella equi]MBP0087962.1 MFS transporter [Prescottella equi]MBP0091975.1 MFS transporter [Prescottella equi]